MKPPPDATAGRSFFTPSEEDPRVDNFRIRPATRDDSANLAIFMDMATRRLASFLWSQGAGDGESPFAVGRGVIRDNPDSVLHHSQWRTAEDNGGVLGGLNGYVLTESAIVAPPDAAAAAVVEPLNALKALVVGSWYIAAIAVFPEARERQVAQRLLQAAEQAAKAASAQEITLMVGSFNTNARRLYEKMGYEARARRDFVSFAGSDRGGQWILMAKGLGEDG